MCNECFQRGYNDFPKWVGSEEHPDSYRNGFETRQKEEGYNAVRVDDREFCQKCYDRGVYDAQRDVYSPPTTDSSGHRESYDKGYYE
jgi:hypothetical protein